MIADGTELREAASLALPEIGCVIIFIRSSDAPVSVPQRAQTGATGGTPPGEEPGLANHHIQKKNGELLLPGELIGNYQARNAARTRHAVGGAGGGLGTDVGGGTEGARRVGCFMHSRIIATCGHCTDE